VASPRLADVASAAKIAGLGREVPRNVTERPQTAINRGRGDGERRTASGVDHDENRAYHADHDVNFMIGAYSHRLRA
jgi:hypothetical protein